MEWSLYSLIDTMLCFSTKRAAVDTFVQKLHLVQKKGNKEKRQNKNKIKERTSFSYSLKIPKRYYYIYFFLLLK